MSKLTGGDWIVCLLTIVFSQSVVLYHLDDKNTQLQSDLDQATKFIGDSAHLVVLSNNQLDSCLSKLPKQENKFWEKDTPVK